MFSGYRDGSFVFNMRAREDRRDLHVMRADKLLLGVAVRRELGVEQKGLSEADIAEAINANGVHYVVMQPGFWTDLEAMQRFERVMVSAQFEEVARIATPANHKAHETELVIYRNKGPVAQRPQGQRSVFDLGGAIVGDRVGAPDEDHLAQPGAGRDEIDGLPVVDVATRGRPAVPVLRQRAAQPLTGVHVGGVARADQRVL